MSRMRGVLNYAGCFAEAAVSEDSQWMGDGSLVVMSLDQ